MKIASEVKIGITGVLTVIVIIWGINYLKGVNILSSTYQLIATYDHIDGIEPSANVMLNGFKIGAVDKIIFESEKGIPFTLFMEIDKNYKIRSGSSAEIYSADLLGSKSIRILQSTQDGYVSDGDTLHSKISGDIISSLLDELSPLLRNLDNAVQTLDSTGASLNKLLNDPGIAQLISNMDQLSGSVKEQFSESGDLNRSLESMREFAESLSSQNESIRNTISNVENLTSKLNNGNIDSLLHHLNSLSENLAGITSGLKEGEGTAGKLLTEDSLYHLINQLVADLDSLIVDVNKNPKKYVSFSLFGK
jgi:phospholipid/cholesterol/gamma-HCH transport system substrate-binding protein